jgi:glutathione S-transferase
MSELMQLFGDSISGNCYKLRLACAQLDVDHDWHETDIMAGESRSEAFLEMNPNGKVPLAKLPDGRCLAESNAILSYLADGSEFAGKGRYGKASVLQWMFFEQYSHEPYIATSRFIIQYLGNPAERQADLESKRTGGHKALMVMDEHLNGREFFANDAYSIADIALYAYTHVAHEGGFDLGSYSNIRAWLMRVQQQENYVPMQARS